MKSLAAQTTAATAKITAEIAGMQEVSGDVAGTLASITQAIGTISGYVDGVAAATAHQSTATGSILVSMRHAANGVSGISASLDDWTVGLEERRHDRRARVLLSARIETGDGRSLSCTIRDLSRGGARIVLRQSEPVPARFALAADDGRRFTCDLRDRADRDLHVAFV